MPGITFPPARSNSGFQTVCKWRMDVSAVAGGQAVKLHPCDHSPNEGIFPLGRPLRSNNESAAHEQCVAKTHGIGGIN